MGFDLEIDEVMQEEFNKKLEKIRARVDSKRTKWVMRTKKICLPDHLSNLPDLLNQIPQFFSFAI